MRRAVRRYLLRSLPVIGTLTVIGVIYAKVLHGVLAANAIEVPKDTDNILWRIPLTMAIFGVVLTAILEAVAAWYRRQKQKFLGDRLKQATTPVPVPQR
jgi:uncharacterized membrane protein YhfC